MWLKQMKAKNKTGAEKSAPNKHDYTSTQRGKKRTTQDNLWAYVVSKGKYDTLRKLMTAINKGEIILVVKEQNDVSKRLG